MSLPDKTIRLSLPYLICALGLLMSLGIGYGSYKTAFEQDHNDLKTLKEEIIKLKEAVITLTVQMQEIQTANYGESPKPARRK